MKFLAKKILGKKSSQQTTPMETNTRPKEGNEEVRKLVCDKFYFNAYPDTSNYEGGAGLHYERHGFYEGRQPTPLIDIEHITENLLDEFKTLKNEAGDMFRHLQRYDSLIEILRKKDVSPNPFFNNEYFTKSNKCDIGASSPIEFYIAHDGVNPEDGSYLETNAFVSMSDYMEKNPDLRAAKVNPLRHLLEWGLKEGRLERLNEKVTHEFCKNSSELFGKHKAGDLLPFIRNCIASNGLAGPGWPTTHGKKSIPSLAHKAQRKKSCFVGVVLYNNNKTELTRLTQALKREVKRSHNTDITVKFFVNDPENIDFYKAIVNENWLLVSRDGNVGFGQAHNALMDQAFASHELYLGLNPDGYPHPGFIEALVNFNDFHQGNALVDGYTTPVDHPKWHDPTSLDTFWVSGAAFSISRKIFEQTGGFDPNIHMYCEDVDLSWRAKACGFHLKTCPTAKFFHDVTGRDQINEPDEIKRQRTLRMLTGALYLAKKWQGEKQAKEIKRQMLQLGAHPNDVAFTQKVKPVDADASIANFDYWLRYSPSRFW